MFWNRKKQTETKKETKRDFREAKREMEKLKPYSLPTPENSFFAMDSKSKFKKTQNDTGLNPCVINHFISDGFLGYQLLAQISKNWLVNKAIKKLKTYSVETKSFHTGIILIENVEPQDIFFGYDGSFYNSDLEWTKRKYNYASNNNELARFCAKLIAFIEGFNFVQTKNENKKSTEKNLNYFKIAAYPSVKKAEQLADALILKNYIDKNSRKDFINAFTGYSPKDKIIWKGHFGDLKTFINHSIKEKFLEKVSQKWIITSTIFSDKEIAFSKDSIRSTKETISKENIKKLVDNCML